MDNPGGEIERFQRELAQVSDEIERDVRRLEEESLQAEAGIMKAHLLMLRDPDFHRRVHELIRNTRFAAEAAVNRVIEETASILHASGDGMMAERSADLKDLAMRLSSRLCGGEGCCAVSSLAETPGAVVAMPELLPSVVLEARRLKVAGFVVQTGTGMSHAAILAKSFGLPVLRVADLETVAPFDALPVLLDADGGRIVVEPSEAAVSAAPPKRRPTKLALPARVWLSVVEPSQLENCDWRRISGVGLYRTEAIFLQRRDDFPGEQEQYETYRRLFDLAGPRPVVARSVDLGGDRPVDYMDFGPQENPYLGMRAHRVYRFHPQVLITQLRAILRAAEGNHRLRVMFPMLETVDQWHFVRGLLDEAVGSLRRDGVAFQEEFETGALIETPSAAFGFARLLKRIDFAGVGTNDLVQYFFAVERNNANLASLYQPEHPVLLELLHKLASQAADAGKTLSICGELAADVAMLPLLVGLGFRDFSVAPGAADAVLSRLASLDADDCADLADRCIKAETAEEVRLVIGQWRPAEAPKRTRHGQAVDPVCGMVLEVRDDMHSLRREGQTHHFCSRRCRDRFVHSPATAESAAPPARLVAQSGSIA